MLSYLWWSCVLILYFCIGKSEWSDYHWHHRGMRRAIGGCWGYWEINSFYISDESFGIWFPSQCDHFPPPILVNSTEPLKIECWRTINFIAETDLEHYPDDRYF